MSKLSIDIGRTFAHIVVADGNNVTALENLRMSCAVLADGTIVTGEDADVYAGDRLDAVEYVRRIMTEVSKRERLNGKSYEDVFAALLGKIKQGVEISHSKVNEVYILTAEPLNPLDDTFAILSAAANKVFPETKIAYSTTADAAANLYRNVAHKSKTEKLLVLDIGTQYSTCAIVSYNDNNERHTVYADEVCIGANYVEEQFLASSYKADEWNNEACARQLLLTQQAKEKADTASHEEQVLWSRFYTMYVDMLLSICDHTLKSSDMTIENIDTLLLIGGNGRSELLRKSLRNRLAVLSGHTKLYEDGWDFRLCAAMGILQSEKSPIAAVYVNGHRYALTIGDNIFGSSSSCHHILSGQTMCPQHFKVCVTPNGNNYAYTIHILEGQVYVGYVMLGKDSWLPKSFHLDTTKEWTAGGLKFELKEE